MKKLVIFYLKHCPYCMKAQDAVKELKAENPTYAGLNIEWIEETEHPEISDKYDYYRVPSVYCGEEKLYECNPSEDYDDIKRQLERTMKFAAE